MFYRIYKIVNNMDDRVYIGITKQPLYKRWNEHKKRWRKKDTTQYTSSILFDAYGYENCKIILEEEIQVENIEHAHRKERDAIDRYKNTCVNLYRPYRTEGEINADILKYKETRKKITSTEEFRKKEAEYKSVRFCCILCRKELRRDSITSHYTVKH